jgi:hypothetical protein
MLIIAALLALFVSQSPPTAELVVPLAPVAIESQVKQEHKPKAVINPVFIESNQ